MQGVQGHPYKVPMGKTLQVLADRKNMIDDLVAAGEVLDMRFQEGRATLSLRAAKMLHSLVAAAGADAGKAVVHRIPLASFQMHLAKEELIEIARELFGVMVRLEITNAKGKKATKIGPLLADLERDDDADGDMRYELSPVLREVLRSSNHWAVLSRKAVLAFQSRYSLRLYELLSLRVGLDKVASEQFSIDDLRALLGVPTGKLTRWQDLRRKVIETAIAEVTHLTGLSVRYEAVKRGRSVTAVKLIWREKSKTERDAAAAELDRSSVGRRVRQEGTAEQVVGAASDMATPEDFRKLIAGLGRSKRAVD